MDMIPTADKLHNNLRNNTLLRSWQKTVVQAYLKNKDVSLPPSSYFSSKNRAYPDVSAMGHNFVVRV